MQILNLEKWEHWYRMRPRYQQITWDRVSELYFEGKKLDWCITSGWRLLASLVKMYRLWRCLFATDTWDTCVPIGKGEVHGMNECEFDTWSLLLSGSWFSLSLSGNVWCNSNGWMDSVLNSVQTWVDQIRPLYGVDTEVSNMNMHHFIWKYQYI